MLRTVLSLSIVVAASLYLHAAEDAKTDDLKLLAAVRARNDSIKVTEKPHFLSDPIAAMCGALARAQRNQSAANPHLQAWIQVYAADLSGAQFAATEKKLPAGSVVIKEKFHADKTTSGQKAELREGARPELFTVMIKRAE